MELVTKERWSLSYRETDSEQTPKKPTIGDLKSLTCTISADLIGCHSALFNPASPPAIQKVACATVIGFDMA